MFHYKGTATNETYTLSLHDALPIFKGRRKESLCDSGKWLRRERGHGEFERRMELPGPVAEDGIAASLQNGVLSITLPDRKSTRLNSSHMSISYAVFCLKKKMKVYYR